MAFRRMLRDGVILPVLPGVARACDIPESTGLRAAALASHSRPGLMATGLAALWVHAGGAAPTDIDFVARAHRHLRSWAPVLPTRIHAAPRRTITAVADPADALVDALRWANLADALPRAYALLADDTVDAGRAVEALDRTSSRDRSWKRAWSAWAALRTAQGRPVRALPVVD